MTPPRLVEPLLVTESPTLRRCWHAVAFARHVAEIPIRRRLLGTDLTLRRTPDGTVHATGATALLAVEHAEMVWVCLEPDPVNELPDVPELRDPAFRRIEIGAFDVACAAPAYIDNNTDGTHVAFVHAATFGAGQDPRIAPGHAYRTPFGIRIESPGMAIANRPGDTAASSRRTHTEMWLPFVQIGRMRYPDGSTHILLKGCCPVDDTRTIVHFAVLRDDVAAPADTAAIVRYESAVEHEDAAVLATLPAAFPLDPRAQVHVRHDRGGIEYRRALAALIARTEATYPSVASRTAASAAAPADASANTGRSPRRKPT